MSQAILPPDLPLSSKLPAAALRLMCSPGAEGKTTTPGMELSLATYKLQLGAGEEKQEDWFNCRRIN